ncbi:carbohydrate porin [Acetobacter orientalis]|uniref:carbohydrate porin n=1 Tax=Acetobacter orientalis TaxID=146474 RepID=UPI00209D0E7D|nr:carbohydrate porin [Acetobacter orientalis]MCP1216347.1 carbohydrate porin [Acetobacter orientalis]MCP1219236.1 carbohydrate porin [Acetobacter orientalis]
MALWSGAYTHAGYAAPVSLEKSVAPVTDSIVSPASKARPNPTAAIRPLNTGQLDAGSLGPDPSAIKRPSNTPIPPSGVPILPSPGYATMSVPSYAPAGEEQGAAHTLELDALTNWEGPSGLLPPRLDALRRMDMNDPYYVPTAGTGHLVPFLNKPRAWMHDRGFTFSFTYKGEAMGVATGGLKKGVSYVHELTLQGIFDLERMARLKGWSVHALVMERAGKALQSGRLGENYIAMQEVYSLSGNVAAHLVDLYAEKRTLHNKLDVIFGRMSLTHVFATSPLLCSFMVTCSAPVALKQNPGFSVYPKATWGARVRLRPTRDTALQVGAYSVSALTDNPSGWSWGAENTTGLSLPVEFTWQPFLTRNRLPGHYVIGYAHDTTRYADKVASSLPAKVVATIPGRRSAPSDMFWLEADQMVYRLGGRNMMAGGYLMAGYVHVTPRVVNLSDQAYGGFSFVGLIPGRLTDRFGALYSWYHVSRRRRESQLIAQDAGLPLGAGVHGVQDNSHVIESYYAIDAAPGLLIQPSFQYMIHPGETHHIKDAAIIGLKLIANL